MSEERGIVSKAKLTALATAIKTKASVSGTYTLDDLVDVVDDIETGGGETITLSAVFDAGENKIFTTDTLDDLKQYLTVTATVSGQGISTYLIPADAFTLSGSLSAGSNTITVSTLGKTTTFTVSGVIAATDVTPSITSGITASSTNVKYYYDTSDNTLNVYSVASSNYYSIKKTITVEEGYRYRISANVDVHNNTSQALISFYNTGSAMVFGNTNVLATDGKLIADNVLSDSQYFAASCELRFYCTYTTKGYGNVSFRNFKIIKYQEVS